MADHFLNFPKPFTRSHFNVILSSLIGPLCVGAPKPVTSLDDVCNEEAICEKFPEALCIPDLCTGQPRFFDIVKKQEVNCKDSKCFCLRL